MRNGLTVVIFALTLLIGCGNGISGIKMQPSNQPPINGELQILHAWHGDYPVVHLDRLPSAQRENPIGYIDNMATFLKVWSIFKPGETAPEIDFKAHLVLFARNIQFYNQLSIGKIKVNNGVAEVLARETRSARPIENYVALSLVVVFRQGITGLRSGDKVIFLPSCPLQ